jgi:SAM-dependent methyltransferase
LGYKEIILCGCPLEHGRIQHPRQVEKDGAAWPPPRDLQRYRPQKGLNTSEEILVSFRKHFVAVSTAWRGTVTSMSGFTKAVLGAPLFMPKDRAARDLAVKRWSGANGVRMVYPKRHGRWPDPDAPALLAKLCCGSVCEIGCGTGRCCEAFTSKGYVGIDINAQAVEQAKRHYPNRTFLAVDWDAPFPRADTYLFYTVLLHIPDDELVGVLLRTQDSVHGNRVVVFESMIRANRNGDRGNFQRDPSDYETLFHALGRRVVDFQELPSAVEPKLRHFMVVE